MSASYEVICYDRCQEGKIEGGFALFSSHARFLHDSCLKCDKTRDKSWHVPSSGRGASLHRASGDPCGPWSISIRVQKSSSSFIVMIINFARVRWGRNASCTAIFTILSNFKCIFGFAFKLYYCSWISWLGRAQATWPQKDHVFHCLFRGCFCYSYNYCRVFTTQRFILYLHIRTRSLLDYIRTIYERSEREKREKREPL